MAKPVFAAALLLCTGNLGVRAEYEPTGQGSIQFNADFLRAAGTNASFRRELQGGTQACSVFNSVPGFSPLCSCSATQGGTGVNADCSFVFPSAIITASNALSWLGCTPDRLELPTAHTAALLGCLCRAALR